MVFTLKKKAIIRTVKRMASVWSIGISGVTPQVELQETANFGEVSGTTMWSELVKGKTGSFEKRFDTVGDFHYSTGLIDSATTFTSATIRVVEAVDKPLKVNVLINGVEANHVGSSRAHCIYRQNRDLKNSKLRLGTIFFYAVKTYW